MDRLEAAQKPSRCRRLAELTIALWMPYEMCLEVAFPVRVRVNQVLFVGPPAVSATSMEVSQNAVRACITFLMVFCILNSNLTILRATD